MAEASCSSSRDSETKTDIKVVPWYNVEQFQKVYDYLFCPSVEKKSWAIDQITIWRLKCTSLPAGVEATFSLVNCVIQDIIWTNKTFFLEEKDMKTMYGTAIIRFVHLMCPKMYREESLINVAKRLRIPTYIIDLRNDINHEDVPSLSNLRLGIEAALKYLKKSYWEKEASRMRNYIKKPIDVTDLRNLFCKYISCQLHILFERERRVAEQDSQADIQLQIILQEMEKWIINHKKLFIQVLVSDGIFIPRDEDFKELVIYHDFEAFQYESNENTLAEDSEAALSIPDLPIYHQELWYDVINMMNQYDIVPLFLEALLRTQADKTVIGQKLIISWANQILQISVGGEFQRNCIYEIFKKKGIIVNWKSMFYSAVINPCIYVRSLLPFIFNNSKLDSYRKGRVMMLLGIYFGAAKNVVNCAPSNKLFTVEDLKIAKRKQEEERQKRAGTFGKSLWSYPEDDSYKTLPLGAIIPEDDEEDEEPQEEDEYEGDFFVKDDDYVEKYFHNNENVKEEESFVMETDDDDAKRKSFEQEIEEEFKKRATLLYSY